jgi:hypothetical protein
MLPLRIMLASSQHIGYLPKDFLVHFDTMEWALHSYICNFDYPNRPITRKKNFGLRIYDQPLKNWGNAYYAVIWFYLIKKLF